MTGLRSNQPGNSEIPSALLPSKAMHHQDGYQVISLAKLGNGICLLWETSRVEIGVLANGLRGKLWKLNATVFRVVRIIYKPNPLFLYFVENLCLFMNLETFLTSPFAFHTSNHCCFTSRLHLNKQNAIRETPFSVPEPYNGTSLRQRARLADHHS